MPKCTTYQGMETKSCHHLKGRVGLGLLLNMMHLLTHFSAILVFHEISLFKSKNNLNTLFVTIRILW